MFKVKLNREEWTAILTQVIAALIWLAGTFVPAEYQEIAQYAIAAIEAIGLVLILIFTRQTAKLLARLQGK